MDNYKQLKKLERSFEGKLTRKLNNLFKLENVEFNVKGYNGFLHFNSKETNWTLFKLVFVRNEDCSEVIDLRFEKQMYSEIPGNVLNKIQLMLDIIKVERELYIKLKQSL
jgi:hypothetical protein